MKHLKKYTIIFSFVIILGFFSQIEARQNVEAKQNAQRYVDFARLPYCATDTVSSSSCQLCQGITALGYKIIHVENQQRSNVQINMVLAQNGGELVIAFGGPKSENIRYFQQIYQSGLVDIPELGVSIEREFWDTYASLFRDVLTSLVSENQPERIVFTGHSYGGSLSQLAAFDLVKNNIIVASPEKGPFIYTFGALKIGAHDFSNALQNIIGAPVTRIKRRVDFFSLMPRCVFIHRLNVWHCYRNYVSLVRSFPLFGRYYIGYSPYVRGLIHSSIPSVYSSATNYIKQVKVQSYTTSTGPKPNPLQQPQQNLNSKPPQNAAPSTPTQQHRNFNGAVNHNNQGQVVNNLSNLFNHNNHSNNVSKERLAHHTPLSYSPTHQNTNRVSNYAPQVENKAPISAFARSGPVGYSGLHSNSVSNSNSMFSRRSVSSGMGRRSMMDEHRHSSGGFGRRNLFRFRFLETNSKAVSKFERNLNGLCSTNENYLTCGYKPEVHQVYFGVNMEECN